MLNRVLRSIVENIGLGNSDRYFDEQSFFVLLVKKEKAVALERLNKKLLLAIEKQQATTLELSNAKLRSERILESITEAFYAVDREWRFTYVNKEAENLLRRPRGDLLGKVLWNEFKEAIGTIFDREYHRALAENTTVKFEPSTRLWMAGSRCTPIRQKKAWLYILTTLASASSLSRRARKPVLAFASRLLCSTRQPTRSL
jgi:PAS domain-containing protein